MKSICIAVVALAFALVSCHTRQSKPQPAKQISPKPGTARKIKVLIQPLGGIRGSSINFLKANITDWYVAGIEVLPLKPLPEAAWYAPRKRYKADTLLAFLKAFSTGEGAYVLGVTDKDISTSNGANPDWGVMGLGYQPGQCCIISDYRLNKYPQTEKQLTERLLKVALHELGHNFGLLHCPETTCIMTDAKGKDRLNREQSFCPKCSAFLYSKGFLKPAKMVSNRSQ